MEPNLELRLTEKQPHTTPTKAKVQGAFEYAQAKGLLHSKQDVFDFFGVGRTQGYAMLNDIELIREHPPRKDGRYTSARCDQMCPAVLWTKGPG